MTNQKNILITGTSRGLGRALAAYYCENGARVFGCSRGESDFQHYNFEHVITDITNELAVRDLFSHLKKSTGRLDLLVNNAGVKEDAVTLLTTLSQAKSMIDSNVLGTFLVTREAVKLMKRGRFGRIVNISSMAVPLGAKGSGLYAAGKAAIEQFSHSLARELAQDDITINTVGVTVFEDSDMVAKVDPKALHEALESLIKKTPLNIAEIAHAIDFFVADEAAKITNQIVYFGGVR